MLSDSIKYSLPALLTVQITSLNTINKIKYIFFPSGKKKKKKKEYFLGKSSLLPTTYHYTRAAGLGNNSHRKSTRVSAGGEMLALLIHEHADAVPLFN